MCVRRDARRDASRRRTLWSDTYSPAIHSAFITDTRERKFPNLTCSGSPPDSSLSSCSLQWHRFSARSREQS
ncbi:hypothetical protein E2C01_094543 [Portunus trituberculatus]|uniref:Uncharacterized protein n=1 Tax=Portunus trituberculatus TaxID=210409 RepID=A0A5B7K0Z5_PORTR|nr:hypothetical protein [Portunus trituberculatus]